MSETKTSDDINDHIDKFNKKPLKMAIFCFLPILNLYILNTTQCHEAMNDACDGSYSIFNKN